MKHLHFKFLLFSMCIQSLFIERFKNINGTIKQKGAHSSPNAEDD